MSSEMILLRQFMAQRFNLDGLRTLCLDLEFDYDELGEGAKSARIRELLLLVGRQHRFEELLILLEQDHPILFHKVELSTDPAFIEKLTAQLSSLDVGRRRARNERILLRHVADLWVKRVLDQSLHGHELVELGKALLPKAVDLPWDELLQANSSEVYPLQPGTEIGAVYDDSNESLLILGEPGSGKTTMMLELARTLVSRAEQEPEAPVPVVFYLSTWSENQSLADWLEVELNEKYAMPRKIGRELLAADRLILLLDGLDEVRPGFHQSCVQAINQFRAEHLIGLVVCSRTEAYSALEKKLRLYSAVLLHPLSQRQVSRYLESGGQQSEIIRKALQQEPALEELSHSPLMLNVMMQAYQDLTFEEIVGPESTASRHQHIFETYVGQMLRRQRDDESYRPEQTNHWLSQIAKQMMSNSETVLLIERIQPAWLKGGTRRLTYSVVSAVLAGLVGGLLGSLLVSFWWGISAGKINWATSSPVTDLMLLGIGAGFAWGAVVTGLIGLFRKWIIHPAESIGWRPRWSLRRALYGALTGIGFGILTGFIMGVTVVLFDSESIAEGVLLGALSLFIVGPLCGLGFAPIGAFMSGVLLAGLEYRPLEKATIPNQGMRQSIMNAVRLGLATFLTVTLLVSPVFLLVENAELTGWYVITLLFAFPVAVIFALVFGGAAVVQHASLRLILSADGRIPWRFTRFLEHSTRHDLLQRVGGGYMFIHRMLMEYFASLPEEAENP